MGCTNSKEDQIASNKTPLQTVGQTERQMGRADRLRQKQEAANNAEKPPPPKLDASGRLVPEEVVKRSTSSIVSKILQIGTQEDPITIEYAHWTQRGYYPDDPHKENQDEFSVTPNIGAKPEDILFGVYDGHGKNGHDCSRFAKKSLPNAINKYLRGARSKKFGKGFDPENWPMLNEEEYQQCCQKAFTETNQEMHKADVEDKNSGTTAITVGFHGTLMTVCNVGDSRAVLGHEVNFEVERTSNGSQSQNNGRSLEESKEEIGEEREKPVSPKEFPSLKNMLAIPLSRDQTPYRKDERERVKREGAAVMSIDQMEGKEEMHENWGDMVLGEDVDLHGDPPRIWVEGKDYPGTAFTRSLGDEMAEAIGVTADPEMLSRHVTSNDHVLVIASDGIFEFLTNQEVIDMAATSESPIIACEKLVKEAYNQWLTYENRTDDITIIVCFLDVNKPPPSDGSNGTTEDLVELARTVYGNRPVRKSNARAGRAGSLRTPDAKAASPESSEDTPIDA